LFIQIDTQIIILDDIDAVAAEYIIDPSIIYGLISKVSGGGQMLVNGYQECDQGRCYGVMRVPEDRADTNVPPDSQQAIRDGVQWLTDIATCMCEARTKSDDKKVKINAKTVNDIGE